MSGTRKANGLKNNRRSLFVRIAAVAIALCMIAALALPALADTTSEDPYTYTVRIFPGDKGTIGGDPIVKTVKGGQYWNGDDFRYQSDVTIKDDYSGKYSATGLRESGKDNNTRKGIYSGSFKVDRDIDLVVTYGIKGTEVAYTVSYLEYGTNKKLTIEGHDNPETFYGNVGDKPVVSYLYVEGYTPQYRNLTGTLSSNAADNDWAFYYVPLEEEATETTTTTTTTTGGTTTRRTTTTTTTTGGTGTGGTGTGGTGTGNAAGTGTADAGNAGAGTAAGDAGAGTAAGDAGAGTAVADAGGGETVNTPQNGPQEIVDVDEQETPLAEYDGSNEGATENPEVSGTVHAQGMSTGAKVALAAVLIAILIGVGYYFFKRISSDEDDDDDDEDDEE